MTDPRHDPKAQRPQESTADQDHKYRAWDQDTHLGDEGDLPVPEPLPEVDPAGEDSVDTEEPLPEPEPLDPPQEASGESTDAGSSVSEDRLSPVDAPPLREVTAPNEYDEDEDQTAGPIAAWTFSELRDAAGRISWRSPEEGPASPAQRPQQPDAGEDAAASDREQATPDPPPPPSPPPALPQRGRTPLWGTPAVRQAQAPSATAASPGSHHPPAASPQPGAEQRAEPPRHPGAPRFAPAHAPAFSATSITQGRPYVPPVSPPGPFWAPGHRTPPPPAGAYPPHPGPAQHPGPWGRPPASAPWSGPHSPVPPPQGAPVFAPPSFGPGWTWPQPKLSMPTGATEDITAGSHRLHGATVVLNAAIVTLVFLALPGPLLLPLGIGWLLLALLVVALGSLMVSVVSWYYTRFEVHEERLILRTGPFRQRVREVPLSRLQAVDVVRPLFMQVVGLSELRVEVAGGDHGEVRLRYLGRRKAERLRAALLAAAAGLSEHLPEAPEMPLYQLRFSLLIGALTFRIPVLVAFALFGALIAVGWAFDEPGVLGGAVPLLLGLVHGFVGPLLRYIDFYASLSPDGLRVRYGVFQARMQTVPPGRVQAVRIVEPLLWRWLQVVRVEANIAGYAGQRQVDSTTLLPVVPRALAYELLRGFLPGNGLDTVRFRPGAREGSSEELGMDDALFVVRRGRFCRIVEVVPYARIQAVRLRMGPLEQRRGTAVVEVEVPAGPVSGRAPELELAEARETLDRITALARQARAQTGGPERWAIRGEPV